MIIIINNNGAKYEYKIDITNIPLLKNELEYLFTAGYTTKKGEIKLTCKATNVDVLEALKEMLPNGKPVYSDCDVDENNNPVYRSTYCSGDENIDSQGDAIITGKKSVLPRLAYIVTSLLNLYKESENVSKLLTEYKNNEDLLNNIEERIEKAKIQCKKETLRLDEMKASSNELHKLCQLKELKELLEEYAKRFSTAFINLINYSSSNEMIDIDTRISNAKQEYNELIEIGKNNSNTSNSYDDIDVKKGLNACNELHGLMINKENGEVFDTDIIRSSFNTIINLFDMTLLSIDGKPIIDSKPITLKEYIQEQVRNDSEIGTQIKN